jgi:hypothetical protein
LGYPPVQGPQDPGSEGDPRPAVGPGNPAVGSGDPRSAVGSGDQHPLAGRAPGGAGAAHPNPEAGVRSERGERT